MTTTPIRVHRNVTGPKLRILLHDLLRDYATLRATLPSPMSGKTTSRRAPGLRVPGHPAEWASDQAARIADLLWSWHDLAADLLGDTPPAPTHGVLGTRQRLERDVVETAFRYLEPRTEQLCDAGDYLPFDQTPVPWAAPKWEWAVADEALGELFDCHRHIRNATGHGRARQMLPLPCPACELLMLERCPGMAGQEVIVCANCAHTLTEAAYPVVVRAVLEAEGMGQR